MSIRCGTIFGGEHQSCIYACLWGNNENDFVYRSLERDLMEEQDIIEQEGYFWR